MKRLGFGLMRLPLLDLQDPKSIDQEAVNRMADAFLARGYTYFDTAYFYHQGLSEVAAREALSKRHARDSFLLADKMPIFLVEENADYEKFFREQLERCGVEYFDYYLLHALGAKNYESTLRCGGFAFMRQLKAEGRARHIGFSFHDKAELLDEVLSAHPEMEFVQLQINYADWENESIQSRACYEVAVRHGKSVVVMEPVKGGALAAIPEEAEALFRAREPGRSPASWALRYTASLPQTFMVLSGMSTLEQMLENLDTFDGMRPLDAGERATVEAVARIIEERTAIPCTGCEYCVEGCPQRIPIPKYFALFNNQSRYRLVPSHLTYYNNLTATHGGRASDCIACGRCEAVCPQHIAIIEGLAEVSAVFDRH